MILPLLISVLPTLVKTAENIFSGSGNETSNTEKKDWVKDVLGAIYDRMLKDHVPDLPGVDEKKIFIDVCDFLIDQIHAKLKA